MKLPLPLPVRDLNLLGRLLALLLLTLAASAANDPRLPGEEFALTQVKTTLTPPSPSAGYV